MSTSAALDHLRSRITAGYPLLFLKTWEEDRWEAALSTLAMEMDRGLVTWSITAGPRPPADGAEGDATDPLTFLEQTAFYPPDHLFLLKDFQSCLEDPRVRRKLRELLEPLVSERKTLLLMDPIGEVPLELRKDAVAVELPLPELEELRDELAAVVREMEGSGQRVAFTPEEEERLLKAVMGLTAREARKALVRALQGRDGVDEDTFAALVAEKKRTIQGSELLEFYDLEESVQDVGGLEGLKDWLSQREKAFSLRAQARGVPAPKGVLLLGVQGCGKSLTARATARLLSFPLVRLDVANLLSSDLGSSEKNMRNVLHTMDTVAPAVLWLDEIEKGFAGSDGTGQDSTMSRLIGTFLTWMEDHRSPVFVIATANSVHNLPPEMLRRGRFDELFFIDLPNYHERTLIFHIHLEKRGWKGDKYDVETLAAKTEGFSGAEIEQIVSSAIVRAYSHERPLTQDDLELARSETVPLSVTMEEKIFELREWARSRCRPATPDSRVLQMLEEENRRGDWVEEEDDDGAEQKWKAFAEHGQLATAIVEFVRGRDHVAFTQLQEAFAEFFETEGEQGLALRSDPNIVLWLGLSHPLAEALAKLVAEKRIYLHPASAAVYGEKGTAVRFPPLASLPEEPQARPAWLPVCLRLVPSGDPGGRLSRIGRIRVARGT